MARSKDKENEKDNEKGQQAAVRGTLLEQWRTELMALPPGITAPTTPIAIYLDEAGGVAHFMRTHWEPSPDGKRPGLAAVQSMLARDTEGQIASLIELAKDLHYKILGAGMADTKRRQLVQAGEQTLAELAAGIDFVLDDDVEEPADDVWRAAKQRDAADATQASVAQALIDFAGIADTLRDRLAKLEGFDLKLIDEARRLSAEITSEGPAAMGRPASEDIDMRNRALALIGKRVSAVRRAAHFVFRHQPDIARLASSAYERRRRQTHRKTAGGEPTPNPSPTPTPKPA